MFHLVPGLEADGERLPCRLRRRACRFDRSINPHQRQLSIRALRAVVSSTP